MKTMLKQVKTFSSHCKIKTVGDIWKTIVYLKRNVISFSALVTDFIIIISISSQVQ